MSDQDITAVLAFWFKELEPKQWFEKGGAVDDMIHTRFQSLYERLAELVPSQWKGSAEGCLAAIIVLDQFPRNLFRNNARAFVTDNASLALAKHAINQGLDQKLTTVQRKFLYMPFQHSEDAADQTQSVQLFTQLGDEPTLEYAKQHKEVIDRFGRFPHRNAVLGRDSTEEELAFIAESGSGF
ncbi:MAG: DUF924 domain-containing protein [Gammaproteobacteria bacterium]|nr:DUF924 domain-containing protein [Gammaproteobacteria bacterium]